MPMTINFPVPMSEITSKANVLRIAAEYVGAEMEQEKNPYWREGCCSAFAMIRMTIWSAYNDTYYCSDSPTVQEKAEKQRIRRLKHLTAAQSAFEALFKPTRIPEHGYWMGKGRHNANQQRRITALLLAAETL